MIGAELAPVTALIADQLDSGAHLGVQVCAVLHGELVFDFVGGWADANRTEPVTAETVFSCFSVSKALTAVALWRLIERGEVDPGAPISTYWPQFRTDTSVELILTHQAGLHRVPHRLETGLLADWGAGVAWVRTLEPAWAPGSATGYHTITHGWLLGGLLEAVTGLPVAEVVRREVAAPLGLGDALSLGLPPTWDGRAAQIVELDESRGLTWLAPGSPTAAGSEPHPAQEAFPPSFVPDWNDQRLRRAAHPAFGAWVTARSLATVFGSLASGGAPLVSAGTVQRMQRLVVEGEDRCLELAVRRSLGFDLGGRYADGSVGAMGERGSAFGHSGHGGQFAYADPEVGLAIGIVANLLPDAAASSDRTTPVCELIRALLDCL